ncbi:MAG: GNAT family N-acetyltransferase [Muribaculaceae bacterium]|nr:GNAT family N-acetyltransferase [Muribaculaceae bacterium]
MTTEEIASSFQIRRLSKDEYISDFNCGDEDLNDFILNESQLYTKARLAVSYVIQKVDNKQVVGFFSLANDRVSISDFESKTEFNKFRKKRFVNEKRIKSYPAVKICRLAIDESAKGMSLGTFILDFIKTYFVVDNKTGCRFITVDAYSNAIPFYLKNKFLPLSQDSDSDHTKLLFFDLDEIEE